MWQDCLVQGRDVCSVAGQWSTDKAVSEATPV